MKNLLIVIIYCLISLQVLAWETNKNTQTNFTSTTKITKSNHIKNEPIIETTDSIYSDTSNLIKYEDLKIYKNTKTKKIVVSGKITKIKDGDTFVIGGLLNVRLFGIDTPESKQKCLDENNIQYNCGIKAKEYLAKLTANKNITCVNNGTDQYNRFLFVCKNDTNNINQAMVKNGLAVAYLHEEYKQDEEYATQNKLGIWKGSFERPEVWRKKHKNKSK